MDKYISANKFRAMMYHEAFEEDSDLQRWDSGCWIRYKMFENVLEQIEPADVIEVRHGRWVDLHCSVCGKVGWMNEDNYCPNCGASMIDEECENESC